LLVRTDILVLVELMEQNVLVPFNVRAQEFPARLVKTLVRGSNWTLIEMAAMK
jgi:hypothetical protein